MADEIQHFSYSLFYPQTIADNITLELGWSWDFWSEASTGNTALWVGSEDHRLNLFVSEDYEDWDDLYPEDNLGPTAWVSHLGRQRLFGSFSRHL